MFYLAHPLFSTQRIKCLAYLRNIFKPGRTASLPLLSFFFSSPDDLSTGNFIKGRYIYSKCDILAFDFFMRIDYSCCYCWTSKLVSFGFLYFDTSYYFVIRSFNNYVRIFLYLDGNFIWGSENYPRFLPGNIFCNTEIERKEGHLNILLYFSTIAKLYFNKRREKKRY